jgi:hypothetical protein
MYDMSSILRTPTKATGEITAEEKRQMDEHTRLWISRAMRTTPIEPDKIRPAIEGLYAAAGLNRPRVVIVPSPLVMAFAYGAAAAIWHSRTTPRIATASATYAATVSATDAATVAATRAATVSATDAATASATDTATVAATVAATLAATRAATDAATRAATDDATVAATRAATVSATDAATDDAFVLACAARWSIVYQGGNMWAPYDCYLTACRDILGLRLPEHEKYTFWEQAAIHGGFRVMHPEFCMVCDFPEVLRVDEQNRPHCETGPSHRWRDGWALYHWHGVKVPASWIEERKSLTPAIALSQENLEVRRAACEIIGWTRILRELNATTIDTDDDPQIGDLVEVDLPGLDRKARFLRVLCGTGREFAIGIPPHITKALDAQAWMIGLDPSDFTRPEIRT